MSNPIIAKRVSVLLKSGIRFDYTHVTELIAPFHYSRGGVAFKIIGETLDSFDMPCNVIDIHLIKDIHHTTIDWYIPEQ